MKKSNKILFEKTEKLLLRILSWGFVLHDRLDHPYCRCEHFCPNANDLISFLLRKKINKKLWHGIGFGGLGNLKWNHCHSARWENILRSFGMSAVLVVWDIFALEIRRTRGKIRQQRSSRWNRRAQETKKKWVSACAVERESGNMFGYTDQTTPERRSSQKQSAFKTTRHGFDVKMGEK